ncbi:MAG: hypothetical protein IJG55_00655 [Synergistaceae bacterium]|nr:hypothetical protein [Synergistaceae bacterium]
MEENRELAMKDGSIFMIRYDINDIDPSKAMALRDTVPQFNHAMTGRTDADSVREELVRQNALI